MYSGLVYEMFNVLLENKYMTAEEADASSFTKQINLAAQLKQCISEDAT